MENEDWRNENVAELCGSYSITDGDIEGPGLRARSACSNSKFSIDCDVYRRGSTSVNPADESRIKFNVPETSSASCRGTLVDTDSVGRDRGRSQDEAGSTVFLNQTSVRQSQEKTGSLNEEPPCSSRLSTTQPTGSGQGSEPELRTNCRMDIPEATRVTEAPNEERFSRQVSLSQSDVMPPRGSSQSKVPCHTIDTPLRSSSQMELEMTSTAQPADVQLMDILDRVGHLVCTSSQPNFLLSDALAVVNASLVARQKARAGMNSTRSSSSPFEDKSCCFQRRIPDTVTRKRSSDYFKVWWLDSPVKMKRRKKRRSRSRLDKYLIAEEKAAALTAKAESINSQCCSPLLTPVQQPINFLVFPPPQPYAQTVGYPMYDLRFQPPSVSVQSATSANRPSVWPGQRQTTASWFTAPPSSDWFSALVGGYGGLGGYNPQPLSLSTRNSANKGEKRDSSNEEDAE
ncbi:unnamed protein product [Dibothriocephalus latus]|uniref:Uncharacterized protein n=1 Tax=Dibothriocephalus latus TaxID=60516 RepID=A0A3P7L7F1_DIBLA|nr:unnamed protein product [Dibothriocephalus latus]